MSWALHTRKGGRKRIGGKVRAEEENERQDGVSIAELRSQVSPLTFESISQDCLHRLTEGSEVWVSIQYGLRTHLQPLQHPYMVCAYMYPVVFGSTTCLFSAWKPSGLRRHELQKKVCKLGVVTFSGLPPIRFICF